MLPPVTSSALVVHCSDHRFQRIFREFVEGTLKIGDYDVIAVPGGPQVLAALDYLPKFAWAGSRWAKYLVDAHDLKRIVLLAHDECGWYRHVHGTHAEVEARQRADLARGRDQLQRAIPGISVETWFIVLHEGNVKAERLDASVAIA